MKSKERTEVVLARIAHALEFYGARLTPERLAQIAAERAAKRARR